MRWAEALGAGSDSGWKPEGEWILLRPGVQKLTLARNLDGGEVALLKYDAGAEVPAHLHEGEERILMLEGSQIDSWGVIAAGSGRTNATGTSHSVASPEGCLLLIYWEKPVRFL